jgi:uncharacterized membrane protein
MPGPVRRNVAAIAEVEDAARRVRTPVERLIDAIAQSLGRPVFLSLQLGWMAGWVAWNVAVPASAFDPPPFRYLNLLLGVEAITVSTFVLISQNRMAATESRREHLNLQINMLAEAEMTNALGLLHRISRHLGLPDPARDTEARELATRTDILEVAKHVDAHLTSDASAIGDAPAPGKADTGSDLADGPDGSHRHSDD